MNAGSNVIEAIRVAVQKAADEAGLFTGLVSIEWDGQKIRSINLTAGATIKYKTPPRPPEER